MQKEKDATLASLLKAISKMEEDLRILKREVNRLRMPPNQKPSNSKRKFKSLYGIFPPSMTTMEDYREVRRSGTPRSLREP